MWRSSGLSTLLVTDGPKCMLLSVVLPRLLQKRSQHADTNVGYAVLGIAAWARLCICCLFVLQHNSSLWCFLPSPLAHSSCLCLLKNYARNSCEMRFVVWILLFSTPTAGCCSRGSDQIPSLLQLRVFIKGKHAECEACWSAPLWNEVWFSVISKRALNQNLIYPGKSYFTI